MSKNKDYQIETNDGETGWKFRQRSLSSDYLDSVGRRWIEGKFCIDYRVTEVKDVG